MSEIEFLNWVRGPGFQFAVIIFVAGVIIRITEILMLGRKKNLAEAKGSEMRSGMRTIITRSIPEKKRFRSIYVRHRRRLYVSPGFIHQHFLFCSAYLDV